MRGLMVLAALMLAVPARAQTQDPYGEILRIQAPEAFRAFETAAADLPLRADLSRTTKDGTVITLQIDEQIKAPSSTSEADWAALLSRSWPAVMQKIAGRLAGYTLLGMPVGSDKTSVQTVYGADRVIRLRFTRSSVLSGSRLTAHVDLLAGRVGQ